MNGDLFTKEFAEQKLKDMPGWIGKDTGYYHINHYGCWHKVEVISGETAGAHNAQPGDHIYMIGEYPTN